MGVEGGVIHGVVVGCQLDIASGVGGEGARLRGLRGRSARLDAVLDDLRRVLLPFLVFLEQLRPSVSLCIFAPSIPAIKPTSCTGVPCERSGPSVPVIFAILAASSLTCSCCFMLGPTAPFLLSSE